MTKAIPFDTLAYSKKLISAGFTSQQAEVQAEALAELVNDQLVTKKDLNEMEMRLTLKLGGMMAGSIALVATLVKLF
jgi:hypothetical protein